jgi:hypothetical protein
MLFVSIPVTPKATTQQIKGFIRNMESFLMLLDVIDRFKVIVIPWAKYSAKCREVTVVRRPAVDVNS